MSGAKPDVNIQDSYLLRCLKSAADVEVQLLTGERVEGLLRRFDRFALLLETSGGEILVYKHAVATIRLVSDAM